MEAIKLNDTQKEMLLEMCKALYPELTDLVIRDSMEDFCLSFEHICIEYGRDNKNFKIIHWFEFCVLNLTEKILDKSIQKKLITSDEINYALIASYRLDGKHPVDSLYKIFKELKL